MGVAINWNEKQQELFNKVQITPLVIYGLGVVDTHTVHTYQHESDFMGISLV